MFLPKLYARLHAEGRLDEQAQRATHFTAVEMNELMENGFSEEEAWRALRENILLPSEYEQPDAWNLDLDPVSITQALTRLCAQYFDEGDVARMFRKTANNAQALFNYGLKMVQRRVMKPKGPPNTSGKGGGTNE